MDGEHVGPFNLGNPGEFTMLELAEVSCLVSKSITFMSSLFWFPVVAFPYEALVKSCCDVLVLFFPYSISYI